MLEILDRAGPIAEGNARFAAPDKRSYTSPSARSMTRHDSDPSGVLGVKEKAMEQKAAAVRPKNYTQVRFAVTFYLNDLDDHHRSIGTGIKSMSMREQPMLMRKQPMLMRKQSMLMRKQPMLMREQSMCCSGDFNTLEKAPRLLHCGHSICSNCVTAAKSAGLQELNCSICALGTNLGQTLNLNHNVLDALKKGYVFN